MAVTPVTTQDLWKKAVDSLDPHVLEGLHPAKTGIRDIVNTALRSAEAKREISIKKRWRIVRRGKEDFIVRDVMEKIIHWIQRFKEVGDNAVQYDPGHAALPWAAIRFILQATINYTEVEREIFEGLDLVTRLLASFREIENVYVGPGALAELEDALVGAYATILKSLAEAVRFLTESKAIRGLKAPFRLTEGESVSKLLSKEKEVLRFTRLIDGKRLLNVTTKVDRTADLAAIADKVVQEDKYVEVLHWMSQTRYLNHHNDQRELRAPATGRWLLNHTEYTLWLAKSSSSILLVHGIPGCGKTILSSLVIDESTGAGQHANKTSVAFFYCSAAESEKDRRHALSVLRSLARQLTAAVSRHPRIHSAAIAVYDGKSATAKQEGFDISPPTILECETLILAALDDNPAILVIDAIDEMDDAHQLVASLEKIRIKSANVAKIFITSRDSASALETTTAVQRIRVTVTENHSDVEQYVANSVELLALHRKLSPEARKHIVNSLVSGAGEMFQWAKLQVSQLQRTKTPILEQDLPAVLAKLAVSTLGELYDTIFDLLVDSQGTARELIVHAFSWLLHAQELLRVDVIIQILANAVGWKAPSPQELVDICRGFIYIDTQSDAIRLVHESVRTYLRAQPLLESEKAQTLISQNCLRILKEPPLDELTALKPSQRPYDYAVVYFGHHTSISEPSGPNDDITRELEEFLFSGHDTGLYTRIWLETVRATFDSVPPAQSYKVDLEVISSETCSPLFPICAFAMSNVLQRHTWPQHFDWNQLNEHGHTALYVAAYYGHNVIAAFLLGHQADPNILCGGRFGTALQCAAYRGHVETVKDLLQHGADPKLPGKFPSVMHAACRGARENVMLALLDDCKQSITTQDDYDSVLQEVARAGLANALARLQDHPLAATVAVSQMQKLATAAIVNGEVNGLNYLLRRSTITDVILPGGLSLSALHGHEAMTTFLIDHGIDVKEQGDMGPPLRCASANGHNNICRILLDRGADVNENSFFGSALHAAAMRGHVHTAKLLIDLGADVNLQGGYYGSALQAACYNGHVELARCLLNANADVHANGFCKDAMDAAREGGHQEISRLLADAGYQSWGPWTRGPQAATGYRNPPPPDILRDSSPSRVKADSVQRKATSDPFDLNSDVKPFAGLPDFHTFSQFHEHRRERELDYQAQKGLQEEASLLRQTKVSPENTIRQAITDGQIDLLISIIQAGSEDEQSSELSQTVLQCCVPSHPETFIQILGLIMEGLSGVECDSVILACLPSASNANWPHAVEHMLESLSLIHPDQLLGAFDAACAAGSVAVATRIHRAMGRFEISTRHLTQEVRRAISNGYSELLRFLLIECQGLKHHAEYGPLLCFAAGQGKTPVLELLVSLHHLWPIDFHQALHASLVIASFNGHHAVCTYLLSQGADSTVLCSLTEFCDVGVDAPHFDSYRLCLGKQQARQNQTEHGGNSHEWDKETSAYVTSSQDVQQQSSVKMNAIESCILGYRSIDKGVKRDVRWVCGDATAQAETLRILLDSVVDLGGPQWESATCSAAECLPVPLLKLMICKGASPDATMDTCCALSCAASREISTMAAVQTLLDARDGDQHEQPDLRAPLGAAIKMFETKVVVERAYSRAIPRSCIMNEQLVIQTTHADSSESLFPQSRSLVQIFTDGPGAVVQYCLGRLPHERLDGEQCGLLLEMAAAAGQYACVQSLINHQIDVNASGHYYGTALQAASRYGHVEVAEALLQVGADPNVLGGRYITALRAAVAGHSLQVVRMLLGYNANTEARGVGLSTDSRSNETALYLAMEDKQEEIVQALIAGGADVNATSNLSIYQPLLIMASAWGNASVVRSLLDAGANMQVSCQRSTIAKNTSALHAAIDGGHLEVMMLLLTRGFKFEFSSEDPHPLLEFAQETGNREILGALLTFLPHDSSAMLSRGVQAAVDYSRSSALEQLLDHAQTTVCGFRVTTLSSDFLFECCISACRIPDCKVVELLLDELCRRDDMDVASAVASIDVRKVRHENFEILLRYMPFTADMFVEACIRGDVSLVRRGMMQGNTTNIEDSRGRPAFHLAAAQGRANIVQLLIENGASPDQYHSYHVTPLIVALEGWSAEQLLGNPLTGPFHTHIRDMQRLEALGWHSELYVDDPPSKRYPPPRILPYRRPKARRGAHTDYSETVRLLIPHSHDVLDHTGRYGSAITLAAFKGDSEVFEWLLTSGACLTSTDGLLRSPLLAAIAGGQTEIVSKILSTTIPRSVLDRGSWGLHFAVSFGKPSIVRLLCNHGYDCDARNDKTGQTGLSTSLLTLAHKLPHPSSESPEVLGEEEVIYALLAGEPAATVSAEDLENASKIGSPNVRDRILQELLALTERIYAFH